MAPGALLPVSTPRQGLRYMSRNQRTRRCCAFQRLTLTRLKIIQEFLQNVRLKASNYNVAAQTLLPLTVVAEQKARHPQI